MGRHVNRRKSYAVLNVIRRNNDRVRAADIARQTGLHPQAVSRLLASMDKTTGTYLQEDDKGNLGIFRNR